MAGCCCGDRECSKCPGEWEPGCDLGANPAFVRTVDAVQLSVRVSSWPFPGPASKPNRLHEIAEKLEWMVSSPSHAVHQYLRNQGYTQEEIQEATKRYINVPTKAINQG